jgi:hypothetical protein
MVSGAGGLDVLRRFWERSYAADYVGLILILLFNAWVCTGAHLPSSCL